MPSAFAAWPDYPPGRGGHLRVARESRGVTEEELAAFLDIRVAGLRDLERGQRRVTDELVAKVADFLHFPPHFFDRPTPSQARGVGFVRGPHVFPCATCGVEADYLCDFPMGEGKTCDLYLCEHHAIAQGGEVHDIHFCPQHSIVAQGQVSVAENYLDQKGVRAQEGTPAASWDARFPRHI